MRFRRSPISAGAFAPVFSLLPLGTLYGTVEKLLPEARGRRVTGEMAEAHGICVLISSRALNPNAPELGESSR